MQTVKWGVLGTAEILEHNTAEGMQQAQNCELYAIAGRNLDKAEAFKEKMGFQVAYGSFDDLLADAEVQAVYIPLPNTMHREWTIKALEAGKHVLCEKPLAPTEADAKAMFDAAKANGVYLMEAFAYQHSPYISAIKDDIDSGLIGDVCYIEVALVTSDYDADNIRMRKETLGGSTYDVGVYCASFILRMLGEEPAKVHAQSIFTDEQIDLYTQVLLEYGNGAKATIDCGMALATTPFSAIDRFQIHGTKGSIKSDRFAFNAKGNLTYKVKTFDGLRETRTVDTPHNYRLEVEQLGRCITEGETPLVSEEFSLAHVRTIERILEQIGY